MAIIAGAIILGVAAAAGGTASSIIGGNAQKKAAQSAASQQQTAYNQGLSMYQDYLNQAMGVYSPYLAMGRQAGGAFQRMYMSPEEQKFERERQRTSIVNEIEALKKKKPVAWDSGPFPGSHYVQKVGPGANQSERAAQLANQEAKQYTTQLAELESRLKAFDDDSALLNKKAESGLSMEQDLLNTPLGKGLTEQADRWLAQQGLAGSSAEILAKSGILGSLQQNRAQGLSFLTATGANVAGQAGAALSNAGAAAMGNRAAYGAAGAQGALNVGAAEAATVEGVNQSIQSGIATGLSAYNAFGTMGATSPQPGTTTPSSVASGGWSQGSGNMSMGAEGFGPSPSSRYMQDPSLFGYG